MSTPVRMGTIALALVLIAGSIAGAPAAAAPGVTRRTIEIGVHGPFTGASPLPSSSLERGARVLWRWLRIKERPIHGRHVRVVMRNDQTNPSVAVAVCKELVEEEHVFMLAGVPGSLANVNQSYACARYAESVGVPYVGFGHVRGILKRFRRYFAFTATVERQARLLADHLVTDLRARRKKVGVVAYNSPTFDVFRQRFEAAMERRDAAVDYSRGIPANSGTAEARTIVEEMKLAGIEQVAIFTSPVFFLNVLTQADSAGFRPLWTGPGPNMTHDAVIRIACDQGDPRLRFLSPVPAFGDRDGFDPVYDRAMQRVYGDNGDDVTWTGWAGSKALRVMLDRGGRDLTRRGFVRRNESAGPIGTGILPRIRFRPRDHFGGRGIHVLRGDCARREWETVRRFVTDF